ncbi:zinc ribbon domain-containing protein [Nocardioides bizhenqiangii]|uniref:C4-type zinc ribbon domain-containing protein n=1 Tax=Nocardioides bizhenqiangii TaxID=3095076 RepID=A0ABZ0ZX96_9ACTN|nr:MULTISPECIES: C4-type zinc ribbon domain-containing protein [unclassified Nocardioides]MDZ5622500.1 C4-type zinc ribbon domain-containing protein [Nocardioides sp. HM23]WQQ28341.1 C4-type zinc ribbon domain-containing protein [Nocardioides sp. HM61]
MKADPDAQLKLLDLQKLDAAADQLRHQRAHLPEDTEVSALDVRRADVLGRSRDQQIVVDDLTAAQEKADADVEQVKARRKRDQDRMDQGLIGNPKDLERMQHELTSLERRIATLEDEELEVMEDLEAAQTELTAMRNDLAETEERLAKVTEARDRRYAEIDAELARIAGEREPVVAAVPADLLALYDRLRTSKGGVGVAELRARQCGGCMLSLDNADLADIRSKADDEVIRCEQCQRILVRTSESGL